MSDIYATANVLGKCYCGKSMADGYHGRHFAAMYRYVDAFFKLKIARGLY